MPSVYKPGEKVMALYATTDSRMRYLNGWYGAKIVSLQDDGTYLVEWDVDRGRIKGAKAGLVNMPAISVVDIDEVKPLSIGGTYSTR